MTSIASAGSSLMLHLPGLAGSLTEAPARAIGTAARLEDSAAPPSTVLSLNSPPAIDVVYARPQAADEALRVQTRAWASPPQDDISALMARNGGKAARGGLADQWRGLGGALLARFATTPSDYRQTMVDYFAPRAAGATAAGRVDAPGTQALGGVQSGAAKVSLQIQTRSGQTVEFTITANNGATGGNRGLQVEVSSSGQLGDSEREALAKLADGFDQALEGLGQPGKLKLDLAGLMAYDSNVLSRVDLTVKNPVPGQALSSFMLRMGTDGKTLALAGKAGDIALALDAAAPVGAPDARARQAAMAQHLQQFDAAAQRSHADAALVALFKDAFTQLHATPARQGTTGADRLGPTLARQVQPLLSGLADFQARFGGDFEKTNPHGAVNEIGRVDYQISQQTAVRRHGASGDVAITQTQSEQLDAHYLQSRHGGMLDTSAGNYDITKIKDRTSTTTLIETAKDMLASAAKTTEQNQLLTWQKLVNHRVAEARETPRARHFAQSLR